MRQVFGMIMAIVAAVVLAAPGVSAAGCAGGDEVSPLSVPACAMAVRKGGNYVLPRYLKGMDFDAHGLTWLRLDPGGYVYVNRSGRVVVRDVAMMDNGADAFHHGLVRLMRDGKYGFADWKGRIVVPFRYEGASNDDESGPKVCIGCRIRQEDEHSSFVGGQWFSVDPRGGLHEAR